jgi:hypothetical protein
MADGEGAAAGRWPARDAEPGGTTAPPPAVPRVLGVHAGAAGRAQADRRVRLGEARIAGDDHGWRITAREATHELEPGLAALAAALAPALAAVLDDDAHTRGLSRDLIAGNRYLPDVALPAARAALIAVVGVALSRTQDDKGRVRWTLLGASDLGPARRSGPVFHRGPRAADELDGAERGGPARGAGGGSSTATRRSPALRARRRAHPAGRRRSRLPGWGDERIPRSLAR